MAEDYWEDKWAEGIDIGEGVRIDYYTKQGATSPHVGLFVMHKHPEPDSPVSGDLCMGHVMFDVPENAHHTSAKWQVESWDPLTISPSILRRDCGLHGFIRDGRWVSA